MAKIGKEVFKINEEYVQLELHCRKDRGFSYSGNAIIEEMVKTVRFENQAASESQLKAKILDKITEYHEYIKQQRKVIVVKFGVGGSVKWSPKDETGSRVGKREFNDVGTIEYEYGLGFDFEVMVEVSAGKKTYHKFKEDGSLGYAKSITGNTHRDGKPVVMDWTEEREAFFRMIAKQSEQMAEKFALFMKSENMELMIDSGQIKMLG